MSSNENPEKADVNITGKDKSTAAKTGTESEPSQKRTIKITETSGTERINVRGSSKKNFKTENFVHKKPNKIPRKDEIKNAQKTLKKVKAKDLRKFFSTAREKKCNRKNKNLFFIQNKIRRLEVFRQQKQAQIP